MRAAAKRPKVFISLQLTQQLLRRELLLRLLGARTTARGLRPCQPSQGKSGGYTSGSHLGNNFRVSIPVLTVLEYVDTLDTLQTCTLDVVGAVIYKCANHAVLPTEVLEHVLLGYTTAIFRVGHQDGIEGDIPLAKPVVGFAEAIRRTGCTDSNSISPAIHHAEEVHDAIIRCEVTGSIEELILSHANVVETNRLDSDGVIQVKGMNDA